MEEGTWLVCRKVVTRHLISMEERTFSLGYNNGDHMDSTLLIKGRHTKGTGRHQWGLIFNIVDYSGFYTELTHVTKFHQICNRKKTIGSVKLNISFKHVYTLVWMEPHAQCVGKIKFRNLNFRLKKKMWGRENHVNFNKNSVLAWYVVKRLHVPKGTTKSIERESIIYPNHAFSPKTVLSRFFFEDKI